MLNQYLPDIFCHKIEEFYANYGDARSGMEGIESFIKDVNEIANNVYNFSYLSKNKYEILYALDLCELIDFTKPFKFESKPRSIYHNVLFSKKAIEYLMKNNIPFTILPGTIYEIIRYFIRAVHFSAI
jgi:hypothetical protein